jgi:hypothetical protein
MGIQIPLAEPLTLSPKDIEILHKAAVKEFTILGLSISAFAYNYFSDSSSPISLLATFSLPLFCCCRILTLRNIRAIRIDPEQAEVFNRWGRVDPLLLKKAIYKGPIFSISIKY